MIRQTIFFCLAVATSAPTAARASSCFVQDRDISSEYSGDCVDGKAHGFGAAKGRDTYVGGFQHGLKHGKGRYVWGQGGDVYEGDYLRDEWHGKGRYIWGSHAPDPGSIYVGQFRKGKIDGRGVRTYASDSVKKCVKTQGEARCVLRREGEFRNGVHFNGPATLADGTTLTITNGKEPVRFSPGAAKALQFLGVLIGKDSPQGGARSSGNSGSASGGVAYDFVTVTCDSVGLSSDHKLYLGGRPEIISGDNGKSAILSVHVGRYRQPVNLTYNCSWSPSHGRRDSCSGSLYITGQKRNITIRGSSNCEYTNVHEY